MSQGRQLLHKGVPSGGGGGWDGGEAKRGEEEEKKMGKAREGGATIGI